MRCYRGKSHVEWFLSHYFQNLILFQQVINPRGSRGFSTSGRGDYSPGRWEVSFSAWTRTVGVLRGGNIFRRPLIEGAVVTDSDSEDTKWDRTNDSELWVARIRMRVGRKPSYLYPVKGWSLRHLLLISRSLDPYPKIGKSRIVWLRRVIPRM